MHPIHFPLLMTLFWNCQQIYPKCPSEFIIIILWDNMMSFDKQTVQNLSNLQPDHRFSISNVIPNSMFVMAQRVTACLLNTSMCTYIINILLGIVSPTTTRGLFRLTRCVRISGLIT